MKIGETATRSGVPAKTIRFYEEIGLMAPAARARNNYREYDERNVHTLRFIARARALGFPLKEIEKLLRLYRDRERSSRDVKRIARAQVADLDRRIGELTLIRKALSDLVDHCHGDDRPDCPILDELDATTH
jgi:Cu(I)-responsive transcriptional regulator